MPKFLEGYLEALEQVKLFEELVKENHERALMSPDYNDRSWFNYQSSVKHLKSMMVERYKEIQHYHPEPISDKRIEHYE